MHLVSSNVKLSNTMNSGLRRSNAFNTLVADAPVLVAVASLPPVADELADEANDEDGGGGDDTTAIHDGMVDTITRNADADDVSMRSPFWTTNTARRASKNNAKNAPISFNSRSNRFEALDSSTNERPPSTGDNDGNGSVR